MSQEAVRGFYARVASDPAVAERYKAVLMSNKDAPRETLTAAAVGFARREGFEFSIADLEAVGQREKDKPLTEEQLENVVGADLAFVFIGTVNPNPDHPPTMCILVGFTV